MNLLTKLSAFAVVGVLLVGSASADTIGLNPVLVETGGDVLVPFNAPNSGVLGAPTRPDGGRVGLVQDTIIMNGGPRTATGYVTFDLAFDLSDELQGGEFLLDPNTTVLTVLAENAHFEPLETLAGIIEEYLGITSNIPVFESPALQVGGSLDTADGSGLWMEGGNYDGYTPQGLNSGYGLVAYNYHLRDDLGWTQTDFDAVNEAEFFSLSVKYGSRRTQYDGSYEYTNQPTNLQFILAPGQLVPEPMSMSLLGLAGLTLLRRRR